MYIYKSIKLLAINPAAEIWLEEMKSANQLTAFTASFSYSGPSPTVVVTTDDKCLAVAQFLNLDHANFVAKRFNNNNNNNKTAFGALQLDI